MDVSAELKRIIGDLEGELMLDSTLAVLREILGDSLQGGPSSVPPSLPPEAHSNQGLNAPQQPVTANQYVELTPVVYPQPPYQTNVMQSDVLFSQACHHSQGEPVIQLLPQYDNSGEADIAFVPQPCLQCILPPLSPPHPVGQTLVPGGALNGEMASGIPPPVPAATRVNTSKKGTRKRQEKVRPPYVKKPPNAFMLFREEQRLNVAAELKVKESATVNTVLGQRWRSLSKREQAKYYEAAQWERLRHSEQHPEWSAKDNYGKKRWKVRGNFLPSAKESAYTTFAVKKRARRQRRKPVGMTAESDREFFNTLQMLMDFRAASASSPETPHKEPVQAAAESDTVSVNWLQMLMDFPSISPCSPADPRCAGEPRATPAETAVAGIPGTKAGGRVGDALQPSEMNSSGMSASKSQEVTQPVRRLRATRVHKAAKSDGKFLNMLSGDCPTSGATTGQGPPPLDRKKCVTVTGGSRRRRSRRQKNSKEAPGEK